MVGRLSGFARGCLIALAVAIPAAASAQTFYDPVTSQSVDRGPVDSVTANVWLTDPVTVTNIGTINRVPTDHNQRFFIYDALAGDYVWLGTSIPFAADSARPSIKYSEPITGLTLQPGNYLIGSVADAAGTFYYDLSGRMDGSIRSDAANANARAPYSRPTLDCCSAVRGALILNSPATQIITAVSPVTGATNGGYPVVITGRDFAGATGVTFGGAPASTFTVDSDTQITAVAPAGLIGPAEVRVVTPSGASIDMGVADNFAYTAPVIPTLTEWAMILFGAVLGGGAAVHVQRRRRLA